MQPGPLVIDTLGWGRKPGTERTEARTIEAPGDLGHDVYGVAEGSPIDLGLRFEALVDGVLVTGTASAHASGECVRCLKPIEDDVTIDIQELYVFEDATEEELVLEDDLIDLEPVLREVVMTSLPRDPSCGPECPGFPPDSGVELVDAPEHADGPVDPRWAALQGLTNQEPEE